MKDKYVIIKQLGQLSLVLFVYAIARYLNFKTKYDPEYIYDGRCFMDEILSLNQQVSSLLSIRSQPRIQSVRINTSDTCSIDNRVVEMDRCSRPIGYDQEQIDEMAKLCGNIRRFVNDSQLFHIKDNPNAQTFYDDSCYQSSVSIMTNDSRLANLSHGMHVNTQLQISKMILNKHNYRYQWNPSYYFQNIEDHRNTSDLIYLYEHVLNALVNIECGSDHQLFEQISQLRNVQMNSCLFKQQSQIKKWNSSDVEIVTNIINLVNCGLPKCERYFSHQYMYYDGLLNSMAVNDKYNLTQSDSILRLFDSLIDSVSLFQGQYDQRLQYERVYILAIFSCVFVFLLFLLVAAKSYDSIDGKMKRGFRVLNQGPMKDFTRGLGQDLKG